MKYSNLGRATLAVGSLMIALSGTASAGWGHLHGGGSSGGSSGVYATSYGSSGYGSSGYGSSGYAAYSSYGSYGSYGGPGVLQRVAGRIHDHLAAKRARHAARRAAYGSSGYYASSGGSSGYTSYSYGSSGYSAYRGSSGGSSGTVYRSSGYGSSGYRSGVSYGSTGASVYYGASKTSASATSSIVSKVDGDAVYLTVAVPAEARIYVNGNATSSKGAVREFVSRGLKPGKSYKFDVRAEMPSADGQTMVDSKTLVVSAGAREQVHFAFADQAKPIETVVTLNVPEGAHVSLGGNTTAAEGASRTFTTKRLLPGEVWDDYQVEVTHAGQTKKKTLRLIAGDNLQLTFAFDEAAANKVALK